MKPVSHVEVKLWAELGERIVEVGVMRVPVSLRVSKEVVGNAVVVDVSIANEIKKMRVDGLSIDVEGLSLAVTDKLTVPREEEDEAGH